MERYFKACLQKYFVPLPYGSLLLPHIFPAALKLCILEQRYHLFLDWKLMWSFSYILIARSGIRRNTEVKPRYNGVNNKYSSTLLTSVIRLNVPITLGLIPQPNLQHCCTFIAKAGLFFSFYSFSPLIRLWDSKMAFVPASNILPSSRLRIHALPLQ